jgi:glutamate dehydrogenase
MRLEEELLASDVPEDPYLGLHLERYFPTRLRRSFAGGMRDHPLRREIIATRIANEMVNAEGITFVFRLGEETGAPAAEIARAHAVASEVFDSGPLLADIESLGLEVPAAVGTQMILDVRKLTERGTRWLLRHCPTPLDVSAAVELYRPRCRTLAERFDEVLMGSDRRRFEETTAALEQSGVPTDLARRVARCASLISALDLVEVALATEEPVEAAAAIHFRLGDELRLGWLRDQILALPRSGRWQALARDALRGDLSGWHSALTAEVMDSSGDRLPAEERITAWLEGNRRSLARYRALLADIEVAQTADLATLSVALREVRSLVGAGRRPPAARA